jgi:hypothetical protein
MERGADFWDKVRLKSVCMAERDASPVLGGETLGYGPAVGRPPIRPHERFASWNCRFSPFSVCGLVHCLACLDAYAEAV